LFIMGSEAKKSVIYERDFSVAVWKMSECC